MASPCLSSGGRAYGLEFELVKCSSITSSTRTSQASSPTSSLSETANSPLTISTRKPRTPRKRLNQTYNEAATILSTAYPSIFSNKNTLSCSRKFTRPEDIIVEPSELLLPFRAFDNSGFLIQQPMRMEGKVSSGSSCDKCWVSNESSMEDDVEAESIIIRQEEEIEEGIDSIMGTAERNHSIGSGEISHSNWYGYPMACNLGIGFSEAFRNVDQRNFTIVDIFEISPTLVAKKPITNSTSKPKFNTRNNKKNKKVEKALPKFGIGKQCVSDSEAEEEEKMLDLKWRETSSLQLKLNYEEILSAWWDRGSPFAKGKDVCGEDMLTEMGGGTRDG